MELYKKYRPTTLDRVVGQDAAVTNIKTLVAKNRVPHAIMLTGPSGCGKTTLARIIANEIGCDPSQYIEIDSGQFRGVDTARELAENAQYAPTHGNVRVWVIDEAHNATTAQQEAMLKLLEDTPKHAYFMLATTNPDKLIKAIHTRCTKIEVAAIEAIDIAKKVLWPVCVAEAREDFPKSVLKTIGGNCGGSARSAMVQLDAIWDLVGEEAMMTSLKSMVVSEEIVANLSKVLLKSDSWATVYPVINSIQGNPESIRMGVLGYVGKGATSWLANSPADLKRCGAILCAFEKNWYDSGRAGLITSCMQVCGVL